MAQADTMLDRINLKRRLNRWRLLAVLAVIGILVVIVEQFSPIGEGALASHSDYVAYYDVTGVISDNRKRDELLHKVAQNDRAKALIVRIDSPGGTVVGGEQLYRSLREVAKNKPVVAVMRTLATSAGYMTALGADYIVAERGTITGSIGVLMQTVEVTQLAKELGITPITIKSSPLKASPSPLEKLTPEARQAVESVINDFQNVFLSMVAQQRNLTEAELQNISDGRVYSGQQALELKLIDQLGGEDTARQWLEEAHGISGDLNMVEVKVRTPGPEWINHFKEMIPNNGLAAPFTLDGLTSIWQPSIP